MPSNKNTFELIFLYRPFSVLSMYLFCSVRVMFCSFFVFVFLICFPSVCFFLFVVFFSFSLCCTFLLPFLVSYTCCGTTTHLWAGGCSLPPFFGVVVPSSLLRLSGGASPVFPLLGGVASSLHRFMPCVGFVS